MYCNKQYLQQQQKPIFSLSLAIKIVCQFLFIFHAFNCINVVFPLKLKSNSAGEALTRLIHNLTFSIPNIAIPPVKVPLLGMTNVSLDHFSCTDTTITTIELLDKKDSQNHIDTIELSLSGIGIACKGQWAYKEEKWPHLGGNGGVDVAIGKSSLGLNINFYREKINNVPDHVYIDTSSPKKGCTCVFDITSLKFNGGITGDILELLHKVIASTISSQLTKLACTEIAVLINKFGNTIVSNISHIVDDFIKMPKQSSAPPVISDKIIKKLQKHNETIVDWSSLSILTVLDDILNAHARGKDGKKELVINNVIKQFETGDNSIVLSNLGIKLNLGNDGLTDTNVTINKVSFKNLNSLSNFHILLSSGKYGLSSILALRNLIITLDGTVDLGPGSLIGHSSQGILHAKSSIAINITDTFLQLTTLLAIIEERILPLKLEELISKPLCLLDSFYGINITDVVLFSSIIEKSEFFFLDKGMTSLFDMVLNVAGDLYGEFINKIIRGAIGGPLKQIIDGLLYIAIELAHDVSSTKQCFTDNADVDYDTSTVSSSQQEMYDIDNNNNNLVNLTKNEFVKIIDYVLNDLMQVDSPIDFDINNVMDILSNVYSVHLPPGSLLIMEEVVSFTSTSSDSDTAQGADIGITNLTLNGLDTINSFKLLHPLSAHEAENEISIGNATNPLSASVLMKLNTKYKNNLKTLHENRMNLDIGFSNFTIGANANIDLNADRILKTSINALQYPPCLFHMFSDLELLGLDFSIGKILIQLHCIDCPATGFEKISKSLTSDKGVAQLNKYFQEAITKLKHSKSMDHQWPLEKMANDGISSILNSSTNSCKLDLEGKSNNHIDSSSTDDSGIFPGVSYWSGVLSITFMAIGILTCIYYKLELDGVKPSNVHSDYSILHDDDNDDDDNPDSERYIKAGEAHTSISLDPFVGENENKDKKTMDVNENINDALCNQEAVPRWSKWVMPSFILSAACMYFSGHINVGASVTALVLIGDDLVPIPALFSFSLWNSIHDMWEAQVYPLSLLIAVFSGAWPYIKLILLSIAWFLPSKRLSVKTRGILLQCLDILGKWSLIDLIVLVMMMVAFRFHIVSPDDLEFLPPGILEADIIVTAGWGIFAFIIATVISLILSHVMIAFHRAAIGSVFDTSNETLDRQVSSSGTKSYVCLKSFKCGNRKGKRYRFTRLGLAFMIIIVVESLLLSIVGAAVDSFSFEFLGLAGIALGKESKASYSLISIATAVYQYDLKSFVLSGSFLLFSFVIPLAHLVVLICLWVIPMQLSHQRNMFLAAEVLDAWSALEVFILSLMAAILEINQFAQFIVGDKCYYIQKILNDYLSDLVPGGDTSCFGVGVTLKAGCYTLIAAALVGLFTGQLFTRLIEQALEDIAEEEGLNVENTHAKACGEKSATMLGEFMIKCCLMEKIDAQNKNAMPENVSICGDKSIQQN